LKIDVEEEFRLRGDEKNRSGKPPIARDGEFDLRYDTDRHDLKASGEGTIDMDRAAGAMARWWQSWWEEEKSARRSRQEGAESGARHFVREHDEDDDGYVSKRELPAKHREAFAQIDRDDDGYLSREEIRRYGDELYGQRRSATANSRSQVRNQEDQTWSEWWGSWWSSEGSESGNHDEMTMRGAREFVRKHDRNDDGVIMRSEMPDRMYDDFDRFDANNDRRLTHGELAKQAPRSEQARSSDSRRSR
jgi:Ca2+-binding EF-hand superfamily protein